MCAIFAFIAKYVLFFANLIFALAGIVLMGVGIGVMVHIREILELIPVNVNIIPIIVIIIGGIIFLIAFFGCCGAIIESICLLITYAICMIILAGLKIWFSVVLFDNLARVQSLVSGWLNDAFTHEELSKSFFGLELTFQCCGTTGPQSYVNIGQPIPASCCANPINNSCDVTNSHQGCNEKLSDYFNIFGSATASILIVIIAVELIAVVFVVFLTNNIRNKARRNRY